MPIQCPINTIRITQDEFRILASEVMHHVFAIHNEFGRFFDELIYKRELASRMNGVELEVPIIVTYESFAKTYRADVLVNAAGLFEFKAASGIHSVHRGQMLNYLLLLNLAHGKVINIRPQRVQHEFVNCPNRLTERQGAQDFEPLHPDSSRPKGEDMSLRHSDRRREPQSLQNCQGLDIQSPNEQAIEQATRCRRKPPHVPDRRL